MYRDSVGFMRVSRSVVYVYVMKIYCDWLMLMLCSVLLFFDVDVFVVEILCVVLMCLYLGLESIFKSVVGVFV